MSPLEMPAKRKSGGGDDTKTKKQAKESKVSPEVLEEQPYIPQIVEWFLDFFTDVTNMEFEDSDLKN